MTAMPSMRNIANGTPVDATDPDWNFETIEDHIAAELINRDGSVAMTGELLLDGNPTVALGAAPKQYVDSTAVAAIATAQTMAKFTRTTDVSVSMSATANFTFQAETDDTDGWWTSGTTFTCPATGLYALTFQGTGTGSMNITLGISRLSGLVGTTGTASSITCPMSVATPTANTIISYITAGSTFTVYWLENSSGTGTITQMDFHILRLTA